MSVKINRVDSQKKSMEVMVKLYCRKNHTSKEEICYECREVLNYAVTRLNNCRYGDNKPNCGDCKTCCYKKDMKEKMIKIMRYSGPRLLVHNPRIALEHIIDKFKYK